MDLASNSNNTHSNTHSNNTHEHNNASFHGAMMERWAEVDALEQQRKQNEALEHERHQLECDLKVADQIRSEMERKRVLLQRYMDQTQDMEDIKYDNQEMGKTYENQEMGKTYENQEMEYDNQEIKKYDRDQEMEYDNQKMGKKFIRDRSGLLLHSENGCDVHLSYSNEYHRLLTTETFFVADSVKQSRLGKELVDDLVGLLPTLTTIKHPNLLPIRHASFHDSTLTISSDFHRVDTLANFLASLNAPPPFPTAISILSQIMDAIIYLHTRNLSHRFLVPDVILLANPHRVLISRYIYARPLSILHALTSSSTHAAFPNLSTSTTDDNRLHSDYDHHNNNNNNNDGMSRRISRTSTPHSLAGDERWTPPELLTSSPLFSRKSDSFYIGSLIVRLLFGPFASVFEFTSSSMFEMMKGEWKELMRGCFEEDLERRLSVSQIQQKLWTVTATETQVVRSPFLKPAVHLFSEHHLGSPFPTHHENYSTTTINTMNTLPPRSSRFHHDFKVISVIGTGGFGEVVKVRNVLDGRIYAIKKVRLGSSSSSSSTSLPLGKGKGKGKGNGEEWEKVVREVLLVSKLQHVYVVRYFQAWVEGGFDQILRDENEGTEMNETTGKSNSNSDSDSEDRESKTSLESDQEYNSSGSGSGGGWWQPHGTYDNSFLSLSHSFSTHSPTPHSPLTKPTNPTITPPSTTPTTHPLTLYIQMEYCEKKTLKDAIDTGLSDRESWRLFRQVLEGLAHIHRQSMIHRDLKPTNIFLDANGDVKIGDFGLAIEVDLSSSGPKPVVELESGTVGTEFATRTRCELTKTASLTQAIGTPFYIAPEMLGKSKVKYDQKVDMYSLGIIFFECCYPFTTGMGRVVALNNIRKIDIEFPSDFDQVRLEKQAVIIKMLLQHDPKKRLSSSELLESTFLPAKVEDEYVKETMRAISNPNAPYYSRLMTTLFKHTMDPHRDHTFEFNATYDFSPHHSQTLLRLSDSISRSFRNHGAVEFTPPLFLPRIPALDSYESVRLIDRDGTIVMIPFDLTLPFARWAARHGQGMMKRWCIGRVYRQNPIGGQPQFQVHANFDIVHTVVASAVYDAEVVKCVVDALDEVPVIRDHGVCIRINHGALISAVLNQANVKMEHRDDVCRLITSQRRNWKYIRRQLGADFGLSTRNVDFLESFFQHDARDLADSLSRLLQIFDQTSDASQAIDELKAILKNIAHFHVRYPISYDPYIIDTKFSAFTFQIILDSKRGELLAQGGRYDSILSQFRHPTMTTSKLFAVGVSVSLSSIVDIFMTEFHRSHGKMNEKRGGPGHELSAWVPKVCDVYVASFGRNLLPDRLLLCQELWASNVRADYMPTDGSTTEELHSFCRTHDISWLVILKESSKDRKVQAVKVRNIREGKHEQDVPRDTVVEYLASQIQEQLRSEYERFRQRQRRDFSAVSNEMLRSLAMIDGQESQTSHGLNVVLLQPPKIAAKLKASKKKTMLAKATKAVQLFFDDLGVDLSRGSQLRAQVLVVDLPQQIIRRIVQCSNLLDSDTFRIEIVESFPQMREYLFLIRQHILDLKRIHGGAIKYVFLYSHSEDAWELLKQH